MAVITMISERECIKFIQRYTQYQATEYLVKGIGDDCAVLNKDEKNCLLLTTDTLVEGVHFDLKWHPPYLLGRKSVSVNLSDIAAMGGHPRACLLTIGFPGLVPSWLAEFMNGFSEVLQEHDTLLVGGDTVKGRNDLVISVTVIGEAKRKHICYRVGARPGDLIFVSGFLGSAAAGLALFQSGIAGDSLKKWQKLFDAHLDPLPQVTLGRILAQSGFVHAMMDISDGLATDLAHICSESGVGAEIHKEHLPLSEQLRSAAEQLKRPILDWVLKGGEDYQLLFTVSPDHEKELINLVRQKTGQKIFCVGKIIEGQGVFLSDGLKREEVSYQGYDHFSDEKFSWAGGEFVNI